jgi:uncharacterized protein (UPF0333 family)
MVAARATAEAKRNTLCAESIALPRPDAAAIPAESAHASPVEAHSPSALPSMSTPPQYTIGTDGNTSSFSHLIICQNYILTPTNMFQVTWMPSLAVSWMRMVSPVIYCKMSTTCVTVKVQSASLSNQPL